MRITPIPAFPLAGDQTDDQTDGRSPGLHASDLYTKLYQQLDPKRYPAEQPMDWNRIALGLAWEQYLERRMQTLGLGVTRPGELISPHGFAYSPDLFVFDPDRFGLDGKFRIGEIKLTSMSCQDWPKASTHQIHPKFDKWLSQVMLYAHECDTPYATLYPYFTRGNYRNGNDPQFLPVEIDFTARELQDNFRRLMTFGRNEGML